jgi:hypothetical protein
MCKNIVETGIPQTKTWRMRMAYWIPKATQKLRVCNTYCFSTAKILHERASLLLYTYTACLLSHYITYDTIKEKNLTEPKM